MTPIHLRDLRHTFWQSKGHALIPPHSIVADRHDTAMFTIAGMQQFIPYLSGQTHPLGRRLADIQHCIRTNDVEEVGDNSHHTMFFMMGNWSLGDYFKPDAIAWSREFLTQVLKLDPRKIAVTAFEGNEDAGQDTQTADIRASVGVPRHKISFLSAKDNRRSPGPVGPCGPCTEMYYRVGPTEFPTESDNVKDNEDNWMEIWNNVFMEFYRDETGLTKLAAQNVDTGMGFERLLKVLNQTPSAYETTLFAPLISTIESVSGRVYSDHIVPMRVIADHLRCSTFLIAEGVTPSNEGRGYVLRRLIRRAYYFLTRLVGETILTSEQTANFSDAIVGATISTYDGFCPFLTGKQPQTVTLLTNEMNQFGRTLQSGMKFLQTLLASDKTELAGGDMFMLYDTYGFPTELTREIASQAGKTIDEDGYTVAMNTAKATSRKNTLAGHDKVDRSIHTVGIPATQFVGYDDRSCNDESVIKKIAFADHDVYIFDKTPFYATMGGQISDVGTWTDTSGHIYTIYDVQVYNGVWLHFVKD